MYSGLRGGCCNSGNAIINVLDLTPVIDTMYRYIMLRTVCHPKIDARTNPNGADEDEYEYGKNSLAMITEEHITAI